MKRLITFFITICLTATAFTQQAFEVMTKTPTPGSAITIEYMPRNTVLQGLKNFEATAYLLEGSVPRAIDVPMKQEGGVFRGSVKTADTTRAVFFSFAKDELRDNNNDAGYYTPLYDKSGAEVPGANAALGSAFAGFGGIWSLKRNAQSSAEFNKKEFASAASKEKFSTEYWSYLAQSKDEADKETLKATLAKQAERKDLSEADMLKLKSFYTNALRDKEKGDAIGARMKERYPNGSWKKNEMMNAFFTAKSLDDREKAYADFTAMYSASGSKEDKVTLNNMASTLANMQAAKGDYEAAKKYTDKLEGSAAAGTLNNIAWKLAGGGINNKPVDLTMGLQLSAKSLAILDAEKKDMKEKPSYFTPMQYLRNLESDHNTYADTYATLLYQKGDYEQAYTIEKAAVEGFKRKDVSMNETFAALTEKTKGPKAAQAELVTFFEEGKYTPAMKEQLQRLYTANGGTEAQWTSYVNNLEETAYTKLKAELAKKMINMPAPKFALKDMDGKEVALASLKGKTVVVDFWATWCGPCIASFPGMQMAVNKYKGNPDVVFLFVDTWENDSNRTQKVTDFIAQKKYPFHVLYDDPKTKDGNEFVVVSDFKVEGIPTKFVIDRNNNIRFKTVGFGGSADGIVSELTAMIDMVNGESGSAKKGF